MKKFLDKIANTRLGFALNYLLARIELSLLKLYHDKKTMALMEEIVVEANPILLRSSELFLIYSFAKHQTDIEGDYAEVGVFKGSTAKAICEAKKDKHLHLFDTFKGLPAVSEIDNKFETGLFKSTQQEVEERLARYSNVHINPGLFPQTAGSIKNMKFAFVHLDVDIYQSTSDCLQFFYERMSRNGIIISHDYHTRGVKKAFEEFFHNKPEQIIELPLSQCMIIKR